MTTTITPLATYRNETPYPFCPGCGHSTILDALNVALTRRQVDPTRVVLVTDIGCSGLSDQYFATSAFHGLHGRSVTYATGIKLARPDLEVVVVMGDGGCGIGGTHLINAARRNIGVTVLVFNNFNFGMTGGQHSVTTPAGAVTSTTPGGNLERPLDICSTVGVNGASYVWRGTTFEEDLPDRIVEALAHPGFALLDVWELCTAYFVRSNKVSRKGLDELLESLAFPRGVLFQRDLPEYAVAYREASAPQRRAAAPAPQGVEPRFSPTLDRPVSLVVAGSAGGKIRSAARITAQAAIVAGLWAAQRDEYPVTVKTGHSVSELVLSPTPIDYSGVDVPAAVVVVSADGLAAARQLFPALPPEALVVAMPGLAVPDTRATVRIFDAAVAGAGVSKTDLALSALTAAVARLGLFPIRALEEAVGTGRYGERNLEAIRTGATIATGWD